MANQNRADIKKGLTRTQGGKNTRALNVLVDSVANVADTSIVTGTLNNKTAPVNVSSSAVFSSTNSGSLTEADHSGRVLAAPDFGTGEVVMTIPAPSQAGVTFNLVSSNIADVAEDLVIRGTSADGITFTGGIVSLDENLAGAAQTAVVYPGGDDDKLVLTDPHNFNIKFIATSTTNYLVTGWQVSDTVAAFGDL